MTGLVLNMTGFVLNKTGFIKKNIARIANSCPESGWLSRCWGDKKKKI